jgi:soluble lytic murein transglycosylase-like protein
MPVSATRRRAGPLIAAAVALVVAALGVRLGTQLGALGDERADLGDAQRAAADLRASAGAGFGPPLLDGRLGKPADQLSQDLARLGFAVRKMQMAASMPAGRNLSVARFVVEGRGDAAAIDRLALWVKANPQSAILDQLLATAASDVGPSDVRIELDALVRQAGAAS